MLNGGELARLEIDDRYVDGLDGLAGFDYVWLLTWLGSDSPGSQSGEDADPPLRQVPFLLGSRPQEIGVFAMRGPRRVNPIGLSLVRVVELGPSWLRFAGVDVVDGTPVVDVKPYVARFDRPPGEVRSGWFDGVDLVERSTPESLARGQGESSDC
jgi:tRNA-Thr(GGU) m(6)t(6)A37 methyltransferase TsaA